MLNKGSFTRDEWNHLLRLFIIMSVSMFSCSHFSNFLSDPIGKQSAMSKRGQEATSSEDSPMAKPKPMIPAKTPSTWCYAARGARGKILRRIWDIRSIRWMSMKRLVQGDLHGQRLQEQSLKNMKYTNHQYLTKVFHFLRKKLGSAAGYSTFAPEAFKTNVLICWMFIISSMKANHLGPNYLANLEVY